MTTPPGWVSPRSGLWDRLRRPASGATDGLLADEAPRVSPRRQMEVPAACASWNRSQSHLQSMSIYQRAHTQVGMSTSQRGSPTPVLGEHAEKQAVGPFPLDPGVAYPHPL